MAGKEKESRGGPKNPHQGHRRRQKDKFLEYGLENFTDVEALELLLYYALPRRDTNSLAHALLDRFGSFRAVLEADWRDVAEMEDLGRESAALLALVRELNRRYFASERVLGARLGGTEAVGDYLRRLFAYQDREMLMMLCLDGGRRVLSRHEISSGAADHVDIPIRRMVDIALRHNAAGVLVAHNHLDREAIPSTADKEATKQLAAALRLIEVELVDHIIVSDNDFVSLRESGYC